MRSATPRKAAQLPFAQNPPQTGHSITLHDTGAGIPTEDLPFIFDRFWRGDKSRTDRTHSGLGLAIAKQIILAHDGTIEVQSEPGEGTTLPLNYPNKKAGRGWCRFKSTYQ